MFEEHAVLNKFRKEVDEIVEIIEGMIDYDKTEVNKEEILGWFLELHLIRDQWKKVLDTKGIEIISGNFARGYKVQINTNEHKQLAQKRFDYVNDVVITIESALRNKGWL